MNQIAGDRKIRGKKGVKYWLCIETCMIHCSPKISEKLKKGKNVFNMLFVNNEIGIE